MFLGTQSKEDKEATITQLTTVHGRHHGPWQAPRSDHGLCWNRFSFLVPPYRHSITWVSVGKVKIHPMRVKCNQTKHIKQPYPIINRE